MAGESRYEASLSTLVVVLSVAAALAIGVTQADPALLSGGWSAATPTQKTISLLGLGLLPTSLALAAVLRHRSARRNTRRVLAADAWPGNDPADAALNRRLRELWPHEHAITIRATASPAGAAPLPPQALRYRDAQARIRPAVLLDTAFLTRFRAHPDAFCAVLLHELAHHLNRDHWLLFDLRRVLLATAAVATLQLVVSVAGGIAGTGHDLPALAAVMFGKSYTFALLGGVIACLGLARASGRWREALADAFAVRFAGAGALHEAEHLLHASDIEPDATVGRSHAALRETAYLLTPLHVVALGGLVALLADTTAGRLQALLQTAAGDALAMVPVLVADGVLVAGFGGVLLTGVRLTGNRSDGDAVLARMALGLAAGACLARLLFQATPLALASSLMPDGYAVPHSHDPGRLLLAEGLGAATTYAARALVVLIGALAARNGAPAAATFLPAVAFAGVAAIEYAAMAPATLGFAAYATLAATSLLLLRRHRAWPATAIPPWPTLTLAFVAGAGVAGAGDITHLASSMSRAAERADQRGDAAAASRLRESAANASRWHGQGWELLAIAEARTANYRRAADWMTRAAQAPLDSDYGDLFRRWGLAGSFWLQLEPERETGLAARAAFDQALRIWPRLGKTDRPFAASVFYNAACAALREPADRRAAALELSIGVILQPSLAEDAVRDADLRGLWGRGDTRFSAEARDWFAGQVRDADDVSLYRALRGSPLESAEMVGLAQYIVTLARQQTTR
ncbi:M48 family metalloprotease [Tahibacter caeni]|uniref:M48 family metalloprotease n=1 Tax=Tahibacter caeni TaxID=1453545 RepID=UPI00214848BF|nr:M48 family metalloprotease [Tahibacter caeni]